MPIDLTTRERKVLKLISDGHPVKRVAHEIALHESTVKFHLKTARDKLECRNGTHVIAKALRLGLID